MDPIQEVIEVETGDGQAAIAALSEIVAGLREELEQTRAELGEMTEGIEGAGGAGEGAGASIKGMSGGISGMGRAVSMVNPEVGSMVMTFGALRMGIPKLAAAFKALPAAMGPVGWAALAISAAFVAVTYATKKWGEELDETARKLEEHGKQLNTAAAIGDEVDALNRRITDDLKLMSGEVTEADLAISDFNEKLDRMTERQIKLLGVEGAAADAIRENRQALKERNAEVVRGKEATKDAAEGARQQAQADKEAAAAAKMRGAAVAEAAKAQAAVVLADQEKVTAIKRFKAMEEELTALGAGLAVQLEAVDWSAIGDEIEQAGEKVIRQLRAVEITTVVGDALSTGGDPLALLSMIPGVGGAIAGGLGGLASLGGKSDEELDAMFGGLADAIIAGIERLPDILAPLVVDFALALAMNLPRALAEAFAGLVSELFALIFPNRADKRDGLTDKQKDEALALAAELQAERDILDAGASGAALRTVATPSLGGTNATPSLAAALSGGRRRGGRMTVELRQAGIFGTTQEIEQATGIGGLRERA